MSPRGVVGSRSGLVPGLRFGAVENAAPPQRHPTTSPAASPDNGAPATDWNDRLAAARTEEFTDLFHEALTEDFGAVAHLHQMLETASEWCRAHGARSSASELDAIADRLTDLGEELHLVGENVDHEIRSRSHRAAAAARLSPAASARGTSPGQQSDAPAPVSPSAVRSVPRSR
ncbi:hypothetical protein ACOT81_20545 [Streptomyces sp. WI04-05B]|uniref:hypothetical protein n=1 Tax=Streptomyces TaxID=1883 RepID=UPI0029B34EAE|nr:MULTISPECIES: hypothetical protein [unclassified Streptomyces]MDX2544667.1 hypothetical protein [Streptomyces sp. WI04-05B]MDX2588807.1 hypothetical protein [Streptomyces sp. WI04-05A]